MNKNQILSNLLEKLWLNYCERVSYAKSYLEIVTQKGGNVVNDHCAFRTFNTNTGEQKAGIEAIAEILETLGYQKVSPYAFPTKHLNSFHFQHPTQTTFPKFFVTQLEVSLLTEASQQLINEAVVNAKDMLAGKPRAILNSLKTQEEVADLDGLVLVNALVAFFGRPWQPAKKSTILALNQESQFAAWTLLHGNAVNHFTAYINLQNLSDWSDIESTMKGLTDAGIPVKDAIEGVKGSKLRQSSTQAVDEDCVVENEDGSLGTLNWSYAYYELAERNQIEIDGKNVLFEGFLGEQATNLFEMTKR